MQTSDTQVGLACSIITNHPTSGHKPISWTASTEKLGNDVLLIRNALPNSEGLSALAEKHSDIFRTSTVIQPDLNEKLDNCHRKSDHLELAGDDCPEELLFYGLACRSLESTFITEYLESVNSHAIVHVSSGYSLLRYREGGFFKEHVDVARDHPVLGHRRLSTVVFCNDDYEGGQLVFPRQGITVEPEQGAMVLFPSGFTHPHEARPVTEGTKYSIVSWYF